MITSHDNKGIKEVIRLQQKAKVRKEKGLFVIEGPKMFLEAPVDRIEKVYVAESFPGQMNAHCKEKLAALAHLSETVSDDVFRKISDTQTPQGILCVAARYRYDFEALTDREKPLLLILEDIQDPGNLGTMFRAGEGAGVTGIIMSANTVDLYNPKTIRSTMGSVYRVPFLITQDMGGTIEALRKKKIAVYAARLQEAANYNDCNFTDGSAFLIGNEANGLREETAKKADAAVRIPMAGKVESLNAAVAASVLLFEAARQRREGK